MTTTNQKLLDWVIAKIEKEYKDDVCLLIGNDQLRLEQDSDGSYFNYFVPANDRANSLARTFIIDGIGYDLYPRSWERMESMANLDDYNPTCLGHVEILYYRSEEDKSRFLALQEKLRGNLENREFMFKKALKKLDVAMEIYRTMMFEDTLSKTRVAAGYIADFLSVAVAFVNQKYFKYSQIEQIAELAAMEVIPDNFIDYYKSIIHAESVDELKKLSHAIIATTRQFIGSRKPQKEKAACNVDFHNLADWYQELCYTWRRIYHWCSERNAQKVFVWGCLLQREINIVKEEFGLMDMDLLGKYNAGDLSSIRRQAEELERYIIKEIDGHGVLLDSYTSVDEFLARNS